MFSCLFIVTLLSPAGKGLTSVMLIAFLSHSHVVSCVRCGAGLYQFLIAAFFFTLIGRKTVSIKFFLFEKGNGAEQGPKSTCQLNVPNVFGILTKIKMGKIKTYIYPLYTFNLQFLSIVVA